MLNEGASRIEPIKNRVGIPVVASGEDRHLIVDVGSSEAFESVGPHKDALLHLLLGVGIY